MSLQPDTAIWCCANCGRVAKISFPTTYTFRRECEHWVSQNTVHTWPMTPVNALAVEFDKLEARGNEELAARGARERQLTQERADWRFGYV